jgi:hypothetical protein
MFEILEFAAVGCMSVAVNMLNVLSRTEVKTLGGFRTLISYLINQGSETELIQPALPLRGNTKLQTNYYHYYYYNYCIIFLEVDPRDHAV